MTRALLPASMLLGLVLLIAPSAPGDEASEPSKELEPKDKSVQLHFLAPAGFNINWSSKKDGRYDSTKVVAPAAYDFLPGKYELKLTAIPGREGVTLYPSVTIPSPDTKTQDFVSESKVPIRFTEEDFDLVLTGHLVTKVLFLPDPEFEELALAGVETLISTRLDPGVDPIKEADRRGTIVAIIRLGNRNKEKLTPGSRKAITKQSNTVRPREKRKAPRIAELNDVSRIYVLGHSSSIHQVVSQTTK